MWLLDMPICHRTASNKSYSSKFSDGFLLKFIWIIIRTIRASLAILAGTLWGKGLWAHEGWYVPRQVPRALLIEGTTAKRTHKTVLR